MAKSLFLQDLDEIFVLSRGIGQRGDCIRLKDLAVTGNDLINQGMKPGKAMGRALNFLLDRVIEDPEKNERETLLAELRGGRVSVKNLRVKSEKVNIIRPTPSYP